MATPTTDFANNPNLPCDIGQAAAGMMKTANQAALQAAIPDGLNRYGVLKNGTIRVGFNAAGMPKNIIGPNAAGQPASNSTYPELFE